MLKNENVASRCCTNARKQHLSENDVEIVRPIDFDPWFADATHITRYEVIAVNGQTATSAFQKVLQQQYLGELDKTKVVYVTFLPDAACQKY